MSDKAAPLVACARMYSAAPPALWRELFAWVARASGVPLEVVEHPWPAPLADLWRRTDLGAAFMCGLPFAAFDPPPQSVAAPVPSGPRYGDRPIYFTDFIALDGSGIGSLADCRGRAIALTATGSHSGYNAVRHHLATRYGGGRLFGRVVGPCETPRRAVAAVAEGRADVAAVDSWALALMQIHEPEATARLSMIESTVSAPIPPLIASSGVDPASVGALTEAFLAAGDAPALRPLLAGLGLAGFGGVAREDYALLLERRALADRRGVPDLL